MIPTLVSQHISSEDQGKYGEETPLEAILLPERTVLAPNESVQAIVTTKRDLCRMRSATVDSVVYSSAHTVKPRRIRKERCESLFHPRKPKERPFIPETIAEKPESKEEGNRM